MMTWFSLGCFFYMLMVYTLHTEVAKGTVLEQSETIQELFHYLEVLTLTMWSFYPIIVFLGRAQCHLISKHMEDAILCILDCLAKLGMEGLVVVYIGFLTSSSSSSSAGH
uniref:Uncharacterized protein n=1 Tax=Phaeocystis antarctica TaxID=33657 RepID=A0A7S0HUP7_9EUKA